MKGQAYSVFKMLIGAVFATVLLGIVYLVATQVECPFTPFETIRDLTLDASKAPGKCFERQNVCFKEGTILTKEGFTENLPGMTVNLHGTKGVSCSGGDCTVESDLTIPISVECSSFDKCNVYLNEICT